MSANTKSGLTGTIYRANQVEMSKFRFGDPTVNKYGGRSASVKYDGKPFYIQGPRMRLPYGLGEYQEKDKTGAVIKTKYSMDFSFAGYELNEEGVASAPKVREFYEFMIDMQKLLVRAAQDNSETWLDMPDASEGVAKALTREIVKFSKDKVTKKITTKWPPTMKAKVGFWEGKWMVNAFDENKERVNDLKSFVVKGMEVIPLLKLDCVNFAGGKVGYSFQLSQVRMYLPVGMPSYAFLPDEEEDTKPVVSKVADKADSSEEEKEEPVNNHVEDSDSGDELDDASSDEESEEEREPTPPPSPKKKKTVKKTKK